MSDSTLSIQEKANELFLNKEILAPMVRASTTPLRTLALQYGASLVYTEEIVDRSIIHNCDRIVNTELGTIDYCRSMSSFSKKQRNRIIREAEEAAGKDGFKKNVTPAQAAPVLLRIVPELERGKLIYQMGTGEANLALQAATKVVQDVDGIDINMGCPKKFSVSGGMGSALLKDVNRACDIIKTLRRNITTVPISCKIRLLENTSKTIDFVKALEQAGVNAIAIHAREVGDESTTKAKWERLEPVIHSVKGQIPTIINGDLYTRDMIEKVKKMTGADSVMLSRPALYNTSVFSPEPLDKTKVIQDYISHAVRWRTNAKNVKYVVCEMMNNRRHPHHLVPQLPQSYPNKQTISQVCSTSTIGDLCRLWDVNMTAALNMNMNMKTNLSATDSNNVVDESSLAMFEQPTTEHRYEDDYFLKSQVGNNDECGDTGSDNKDKDKSPPTNGNVRLHEKDCTDELYQERKRVKVE